MFGTQNLLLFVTSGILLNLTPGQDTLYIVGRSVAQGRRAGVLSVLGIVSGSVVHTLAAAFGLSAILATSAQAFLVVRIAGAAYLTYLGLRMIFERSRRSGQLAEFKPDGSWAIYRAGFFSNLLNPKVALFFLAFLPQFVAPSADSTIVAFLFLGSLFIWTGTLWCLILAWSASSMSRRLRANPSAGSMLRRAAGAMFVVLGVRLAITK
ncbi:MAG: LysE family translocator [Vicinamibacterales bacterium]